ncbi:50S ribosomal protein L11 methyltransferase [Laceyella putida]|uniref:Ribosomal protein L11 methyltransferase n=1 Tax=Laceyella putida TaxID=110101 RepID=A0ABW2RHY5_9BACL
MNWIEICVHTSQEATEAVSYILQELGADGVSIEDPEVLHRTWDNQFGEIIELSPDDYPQEGVRVKAYLSELECTDVDGFVAEVKERLAELQAAQFDVGSAIVTTQAVSESSWEDEWKKYYKTIKVTDRIVIKPEWERYTPASPDERIIELDPGMAFGTGTHPTTMLSIRLLEKYLKPGQRVIDVGCGSGILSIVAGKLGAEPILALDLDPLAVEKARENIALNHLSGRVTVRQGDLLKGVAGTADVVVANILAEIILKFVHELPRVLVPGGTFVASGIIEEKKGKVEEALAMIGLEILETIHQDGWVAIAAKKW